MCVFRRKLQSTVRQSGAKRSANGSSGNVRYVISLLVGRHHSENEKVTEKAQSTYEAQVPQFDEFVGRHVDSGCKIVCSSILVYSLTLRGGLDRKFRAEPDDGNLRLYL